MNRLWVEKSSLGLQALYSIQTLHHFLNKATIYFPSENQI